MSALPFGCTTFSLLSACPKCGAMVLVGQVEFHDEWHDDLEARWRAVGFADSGSFDPATGTPT
jgi:hypothetical protein